MQIGQWDLSTVQTRW